MKKVSVIVPVYNTEKYLKRCLDSLVKQTLENLEIIVIEDCSPDNSKDILKEYEKKYKDKIKVFHNKTNKGIGYNRNLGIKNATGKYVAFVDSDDYVDFNYFEKMYDYAEENECDLVVSNLKRVDESDKKIGFENIPLFADSNVENNPDLLLNINLGPANKLFRKELFDKDTKFSEEYKYEDLYVLPKLIVSAKKIGRISDTNYNYVIHNYSQTTTLDKKVFDILKVLDKVNVDLKECTFKEEIEYLNIRTICRYTLQQRYQKDKSLINKFIDEAFIYLNNNFPNWKKNNILKKRNVLKRTIEKNKFITKIYCYMFQTRD